jgi:hypothetical protein
MARHKGHEAIYTYGPLIHNPQTVELLQERGIVPVRSLEEFACAPVGALISQWGSFLDALVAVGLITADEALRRRLVRGDRLTRDEIAALIRSAHRENGGTLDRAAWRRFRTGTARETGRSVPHETTVVDRLDAVDFDAAVAIALRMAPVDTDERKIS